MIGLVLVSHSHRLAEGVRELAEQMSQGRVPIAAAGGLDDETIGTNAERILTAIEAVYQPDGVLVLVDQSVWSRPPGHQCGFAGSIGQD